MIRIFIRRIAPKPLYYGASQMWRRGKEGGKLAWKQVCGGRPEILLHFGCSPGDDLLCTAVIRELRNRGINRIWMMSDHPSLFEQNIDLANVIPVTQTSRAYANKMEPKFRNLKYVEINRGEDASSIPSRHIIGELCASAGIKGKISLRPYFELSANEKNKQAWATGMIAIQSSGLAGLIPMKNKQWYPERFQAVVDALKNSGELVQVGSLSDPPLRGVKNLAGKTGIRETAAILSQCRLFIGNVGFLMHLARAVETRSVIIYGGREAPWQSGYSCNINLYTAEPCAPCWAMNRCDYDRACMDKIAAADVIAAVEQAMAMPESSPLAEDFCDLDQAGVDEGNQLVHAG